MFQLKYAAPSKNLTEFVSAFYLFDSDEAEIEELERADIGQFRFVYSGGGHVGYHDGSTQQIFPISIYGPRNRVSRIFGHGPVRMFGFGMQPAGWALLTRANAFDHANTISNAQIFAGGGINDLAAELAPVTTLEEMVIVSEKWLHQAINTAEHIPLWFIRTVDAWLGSTLIPDIADLVAATGLSRGQTERMIKQFYGATPKLLTRKYRALRTANVIAQGEQEWQNFVGEAYYDQSHLIREVREFTGMTPTAIKAALSRLTSLTFTRRRLGAQIAKLSAEI